MSGVSNALAKMRLKPRTTEQCTLPPRAPNGHLQKSARTHPSERCASLCGALQILQISYKLRAVATLHQAHLSMPFFPGRLFTWCLCVVIW